MLVDVATAIASVTSRKSSAQSTASTYVTSRASEQSVVPEHITPLSSDRSMTPGDVTSRTSASCITPGRVTVTPQSTQSVAPENLEFEVLAEPPVCEMYAEASMSEYNLYVL